MDELYYAHPIQVRYWDTGEQKYIGGIGYPCTSINNTAFKNHSFSDIITVYTTSAYADTALTNIRNGATNATIIIKDSTTGETLVTSTP